jgi:hypothetical protein
MDREDTNSEMGERVSELGDREGHIKTMSRVEYRK